MTKMQIYEIISAVHDGRMSQMKAVSILHQHIQQLQVVADAADDYIELSEYIHTTAKEREKEEHAREKLKQALAGVEATNGEDNH